VGQFTCVIPKPFIFHITIFTGTTCLLNLFTLITDKPHRTVNNVHIRDMLFFGKASFKNNIGSPASKHVCNKYYTPLFLIKEYSRYVFGNVRLTVWMAILQQFSHTSSQNTPPPQKKKKNARAHAHAHTHTVKTSNIAHFLFPQFGPLLILSLTFCQFYIQLK